MTVSGGSLFALACLAYWAGQRQMLAFLTAVYPAVAAGAFLASYLLVLEDITWTAT